MPDPHVRILIVGAGIAGLAVARALRIAGFRPDVVEELPATTVPGAGIYLPGNAARVLRALDLDAPVRPLGDRIDRHVYLDPRGRTLCELDVAGLWDGVGESRALSRADLQRVLLSSVGGQVRYDTAVRGLEIGDSVVKVDFGGGARAAYDLVIGADGRRSTVRTLAELGGPATPTGRIVYRSVVSGGPSVTELISVLGRRASFTVMPMGGGRLYCYVEEPAPSAGSPPGDPLTRVPEAFGGYGGPVPAVLEAMRKVQVARTDEVVLPRWSRGPVLLVGDAAHATSPTLAQGAAMAFEDAVVLGEVLAAGFSPPAAVIEYERRRRPRTAAVLRTTRARDRALHRPSLVRDRWLRWRGGRVMAAPYLGLRARV